MTAAWQLKILVVEEDGSSRTIIRQMLRQAGVTQVRLLKNAAALLRQFEQIDVDLLLLSTDSTELLRGADLVRFLLRRQRLRPCCRVVFITGQPDEVLADLPYLPLPCRVVSKPLSHKLVFDVLRESAVMLDQAQQLLRAVRAGADSSTLRRLIRIRAGQLPLASRDAIRLMQVHLLLDWRYPAEAWQLAGRIRDPLLGLELRLELAYLLGDSEALQQQLQLMEQQQQLKRKQSWYLYRFQALQVPALPDDLLAGRRDSELTHYEIALKAILAYQQQGFAAARIYLENRLGQTRDYCQRNSIALVLLALTLLDGCYQAQIDAHLTLAQQYAAEINPDVGLLDFRRFSTLMAQALMALQGVNDTLQEICQQLVAQQAEWDAFQGLFAAFICLRAGRTVQATGILWWIDVQIAQMPMAAERLSIGFFHRALFDLCQPDPELAAETYTQWGLAHHDSQNWYRALKMFWQAQRLAPAQSDYLLNLLTQMRLLQREIYWDQSCEALIQQLDSLPLTTGQQAQLSLLRLAQQPRRAVAGAADVLPQTAP